MGSGDKGRDSAGAPLGYPPGPVKVDPVIPAKAGIWRSKLKPAGTRSRPSPGRRRGLFTAPAANILPGKAVLVNHAAMEGDRIARATARIEAAARRIEVAAGRSASGGDPELAAKYHALRTGTGEALAELDRLIGSLER